MGRRTLVIASVGIVFALSAEGCSSTVGQVRGHVLVFSPVAHPGSTTTLPVARFQSTVVVKQGKRIVAKQEVLPGAQFRFPLAPGVYDLTATGIPFCHSSATVVAGQTTNVNVRCVEP